MNCKECLPLVAGYLDEELSELQAAPLRQHFLDCRSCRCALAAEKSLRRWFSFENSLDVVVPEGFARRVARRAFAGDTGSSDEIPFLVPAASPRAAAVEPGVRDFLLHATAAAAVLLLVFSAWMRSTQLPASDNLSATEQGATLEQLLERADELNAADARRQDAQADEDEDKDN